MGTSAPAYIAQLQTDWAAKATLLQQNYVAAKASTDQLQTSALDNEAYRPAATQAALAELTAAKAYNDFLNTGSAINRLAQDIGSRLNGPGQLSTLERSQLQIEKQHLDSAWEAFNDFKQTNNLKPLTPPPVFADNRIHYADGSVQWDTNTLTGQLGSAWDATKALMPQLMQAATQSPADQYTQCVGVIDGVVGGFAGKLLPGAGAWGQMSGETWEAFVGKAFNSDGASAICRIVYPATNVPGLLRKYGAVHDGYDETFGALFGADGPDGRSATCKPSGTKQAGWAMRCCVRKSTAPLPRRTRSLAYRFSYGPAVRIGRLQMTSI